MKMRIQYQEHKIMEVMSYFVKGFSLKKGESISDYETTYDPHTGKVIVKLYIHTEKS